MTGCNSRGASLSLPFHNHDYINVLPFLLFLLSRRSLPLTLLNEPDPQGYLRITAYVVGPNDSPPSPNDADSEDEAADAVDDIRNAVLDVSAPQAVEGGKPYHVYVSVHRVEHLPKSSKGKKVLGGIRGLFISNVCLVVDFRGTRSIRYLRVCFFPVEIRKLIDDEVKLMGVSIDCTNSRHFAS